MNKHLENVLIRLYENSTPPLDFTDVLEYPDKYEGEYYTNHTLSSEKQNEIVNSYIEEHDLGDKEARDLRFTAILVYGPRTPDMECRGGGDE